MLGSYTRVFTVSLVWNWKVLLAVEFKSPLYWQNSANTGKYGRRQQIYSLHPTAKIRSPSIKKLATLCLISKLFTWASESHNTGQHSISPFVCIEIKLSVQFTERQSFGVDGKLLRNNINKNRTELNEPGLQYYSSTSFYNSMLISSFPLADSPPRDLQIST